jgi:hypothetical protein
METVSLENYGCSGAGDRVKLFGERVKGRFVEFIDENGGAPSVRRQKR